MAALIEKLETSLNEMKFLRGKLSDLHTRDLKEITALIQGIIDAGEGVEASELLKNTLTEYRDFQIINYYLAMLAYFQGENGDAFFSTFVSYVSKLGRSNLVNHMCQEVLEHYDSLFVYTTLAQQAERAGNREQLLLALKQLLTKSPADFITAKKLARLYMDTDKDQAHGYFELALARSFDASDFGEAVNIWKQLVANEPGNVNFLINWAKKLTQHISSEAAYELFSSLLKAQENNREDSKHAIIKIIKAALEIEVVLHSQFFLILRAYKDVYAEHNYLLDFLALSGLPRLIKSKKNNKSPVLLLTHINRFEKMVKLDQGSFVHHKAFGLGMIQRFKKETRLSMVTATAGGAPKLVCDFQKKRGHEMSLDIALKSLTVCYEKHLVALKLFKPQDFTSLMAAKSSVFTKEVLLTLERPATQKEIHDLLVPAVFTEELWNSKWREMKQVFATSAEMEYNGKTYALVEEGLDFNARALRAVQQTANATEKVRIIENYLFHKHKPANQVVQKLITELYTLAQTDAKLACFVSIFIEFIAKRCDLSLTNEQQLVSFAELYSLENFIASYNFASSQNLRNLLVEKLQQTLSPKQFYEALEHSFSAAELHHRELIFSHIRKQGNKDFFQRLVRRLSDQYLDCPEAYMILGNYFINSGFADSLEPKGIVFHRMVRLLSELTRLVAIEKDPVRSKRLLSYVTRVLFEDDTLLHYLASSDPAGERADAASGKAAAKERIFKELTKQTFHTEAFKVKFNALREQLRQRMET